MSYLRDRDAQRQIEQGERDKVLAIWRDRLNTLDWDYVRERVAANGDYNLGTTQELLHKVIQPDDEHNGVFKKEPGGALAVVALVMRLLVKEQGLYCEIDDRHRILVSTPPEIILTNEADAPNV